MNERIAGMLDEIGWSDGSNPSHARGVTTSLVTLVVGGLYWVAVWFPFAYLALRVRAWRKGSL
ncbi:MAG: hypothetical protein JO318_20505 [Chloroflexi bacterium]|nr:hypothetical protein [Chloroflexota bacterium]